jgi:flagellin
LGLRISTNVTSMRANRELDSTTRTHTRTLERLASGDRITRSGDDAAGLSISEKLKGSIRSYQAAQRNTQDGISMIQTAEGGLVEAQNMLVRLRELSVQAASDTIGDEERSYTNKEFQQLKQEIQRIANSTVYDGTPLLNGAGPSVDFQIGIDHDSASRLTYSSQTANILPSTLGIASLDISSKDAARDGLAALDTAINRVSGNRAYLGGLQSELGSHMTNVDVHRTNLAEGNSRLRDADFAEWTSKEVSEHIRQDAGNAVLVQANATPKAALTLLEKA